MAEKEEKVDHIIRSEDNDSENMDNHVLSKSEIDSLISKISKPKDETSYFQEFSSKFVSAIENQTTILEKALNEVSKQIKLSRLQSLVKDKLVTERGNVKELSPSGMATRFSAKKSYDELSILKELQRGSKKDRQSFAKDGPMMVVIQDITPEAAEKIRGMSKIEVNTPETEKESKDSNALQKLLAFSLGALGLLGAVEKLFKMSFTDGNFQGIGKTLLTFVTNGIISLVGKIGKVIPKVLDNLKITPIVKELGQMFKNTIIKLFGKPGAKAISKVGAGLSKLGKGIFGKTFLKRLPFVGGLFSFGVGLDRLSKGDFVGGLTDLVSGLLSISVVGYPFALALDIFTAVGDIQEGKARKEGRINWKMKVNEWFSKNARNLPILGSMIRIGEAVGHVANGDLLLGLKTFIQSMGVNVGLTQAYDWLSSVAENNPESYVAKAFNFRENIINWIKERADKLPILGLGKKISEAFSKISSGNVLGGFKDLVSSLGGGFGLSTLISWLSGTMDKTVKTPVGAISLNEIVQTFIGSIVDIFKSMLNKAVETIKNALSPTNAAKGVVKTASKAIGLSPKQDLFEGNERDVNQIRLKSKVSEEKIHEVYKDVYNEEQRNIIIENNRNMIISKDSLDTAQESSISTAKDIKQPIQESSISTAKDIEQPIQKVQEGVKVDPFMPIPEKRQTIVPKPMMKRVEVIEKTKETSSIKIDSSNTLEENMEVQKQNTEILQNIERLLSENGQSMNLANSVRNNQVNTFMTGGSTVTGIRDKYRKDNMI